MAIPATISTTIAIFSTGGTIDKFYFDAKDKFCVGEPQIESVLAQANVTFDYTLESIVRKDSLDLTATDIALICDTVLAAKTRRILITHGTDALLSTARALKSRHCTEKTIVLIGAMQPELMRASDAHFNVGYGIAAAQLLPPGVYAAMNGCIFDPDSAVKNVDEGVFQPASQQNKSN